MKYLKQPTLTVLSGATKKRNIVSFVWDWVNANTSLQNLGGFQFHGNTFELTLDQIGPNSIPSMKSLTLTQSIKLSSATGMGAGDLAFWGSLLVYIPFTGQLFRFAINDQVGLTGAGFVSVEAVISACVPILSALPTTIIFGKIYDGDLSAVTSGILSATLTDFEMPSFVTSGISTL